MNPQINIGDVWKLVDYIYINIADVWRPLKQGQINIGDVWQGTYQFKLPSKPINNGSYSNRSESYLLWVADSAGFDKITGFNIYINSVFWNYQTVTNSVYSEYSEYFSGLTPGSYTFSVKAINPGGESTALNYNYTYSVSAPSVTTNSITDIGLYSATSGGVITNDGNADITHKGICWSTSSSPQYPDNIYRDAGTGTGNFTSYLEYLTSDRTYYVRAFAVNSAGTGYGSELSFSTQYIRIPELTTNTVTAISDDTATCGGEISWNGYESVFDKGVCWNTTGTPTVFNNYTNEGSGDSSFTSYLTGLSALTTYYVRSYGRNSAGVGYGSQRSFITSEFID